MPYKDINMRRKMCRDWQRKKIAHLNSLGLTANGTEKVRFIDCRPKANAAGVSSVITNESMDAEALRWLEGQRWYR